MRSKVSMLMMAIGIVLVALALTMTGQTKMAIMVLGLIVAAGGCVMLLFNDRFVSDHRGFVVIIATLFIILIIGYLIKILS